MPDDENKPSADLPAAGGAAKKGTESKPIPEGMRVVRRHRKKGGRQTVILKQREVLREMHEEAAPVVGVKEQVERLKSARKAKEDGKPLEDHWGGPRTKQHGVRWILLRVFALTIPVLAIITAFLLVKGEKGQELKYDPELILSPPNEAPPYAPDGPVAWFYDHPHEAFSGAVEILEQLNKTLGEEPPGDLLRNSSEALRRIADRGLGWDTSFLTGDLTKLKWWTAKSEQTGYLVLTGRHASHSKFRCYFVKTEEGLRLDWEASVGWCDVPIGELEEEGPEQPVLVRCLLEKNPNYDGPGRAGGRNSWYLARTEDSSAHVWGYVPEGSALDRKLQRTFRFGMMVLERKPEVRVVLRMKRTPGDFQPNEFEIIDLLTEEWVLPEARGR